MDVTAGEECLKNTSRKWQDLQNQSRNIPSIPNVTMLSPCHFDTMMTRHPDPLAVPYELPH